MMRIYTKTGDAGETGLFGGPRVGKDSPRIEAYGTIDELNAVLGLLRAEPLSTEIDQRLAWIQHHLFAVGAELATPDPAAHGTKTIGPEQASWLEQEIDQSESQLTPLKSFILPGGTRAAALLHLARCVCRRGERTMVALSRQESVSGDLLIFVNRLSDLLFVLARLANYQASVSDVAWHKET